MTSHRPENVTCLPCREHAHREYPRLAGQVERPSGQPGLPVTGAEAASAVARLQDLAKRFSG